MTTPLDESNGAARPHLPVPLGKTLEALIPQFLGWLRFVRLRTENTGKAYGHDLAMFVEFCRGVGVTLPDQVTFRTVEMYCAWLLHERARKPSTANRHRYAIGELFKYLRREGIVLTNPVADVFPMKQGRRLPSYLSIAEQERVLRVVAKDTSLTGRRDLALVATALFCGLRCAELAGLRMEHVDLEAGVLRVVGKGDKERESVVIPRLRTILADYLENVRPALMALPIRGYVCREGRGRTWVADYKCNGKRYRWQTGAQDEAEARAILAERIADLQIRQTSPFLFVRAGLKGEHRKRKAGLPLLTRSIFMLIRRGLTPIVGRPVAPHMLRHSFASRLRENGADLVLIQEAMGHAQLSTTAIYAHLSSKKQRADVAKYLGAGA
jgi:integrase/recombinase XerC